MLSIHWTAEHPDGAPVRAGEHDRFIALAEHDLEHGFGRTDQPLTAEQREELDELIKLFGGRRKAFRAPWHRTTPKDCFALVKERWSEDPAAGPALEYIYQGLQRRNNLFLHSSPTAFRQTIATGPNGRRQLNRVGPDSRWAEALQEGIGGYYLVFRVLAQEFRLDKEPLAELYNRTIAYCRTPEEFPELATLPDDVGCPCNSGRTVADCHRS